MSTRSSTRKRKLVHEDEVTTKKSKKGAKALKETKGDDVAKAPKPKKASAKAKEVAQPAVVHLNLSPLADVLVFGSGEVGQLGLGNDVLEKQRPAIVPQLQDKHIFKVSVGGLHVAVLVQAPDDPDRTSLWTWGCNDQKILGRDTPSSDKDDEADLSMVPGLVPTLEGKHIVDVKTGDFHMIALDNQGRVYVWGTYKDAEGFLGFTRKQKEEQDAPILLEDLKGVKVVQISSGYNHTLVLTEAGEVYVWGFTWLGRRVSDRNRKIYLKPARVAFPRSHGKEPKIASIYSGGYHSFAITTDGEVFSWGLNNAGQLGLGDEKPRSDPTHVTAFHNVEIVSIVGGQHHTIALAKNGTVYSFGRGDYGQLGHEDTTNVLIPKVIASFTEPGDSVVSIGSGDSHSLAVTEKGALYVWGFGEQNQLGLGKEEDETTPTKLNFNKYIILSAGGGGQHSTLVAKKKEQPPQV